VNVRHRPQSRDVSAVITRTLIVYPSDGLNIYSFMNVPSQGTPPYPVVIAIHGYIDPGIYTTLDYTTRYADALARAGYIVLHPNLRGYAPSDNSPSEENLFRVGFAIDVLNLIALVKAQGGQPQTEMKFERVAPDGSRQTLRRVALLRKPDSPDPNCFELTLQANWDEEPDGSALFQMSLTDVLAKKTVVSTTPIVLGR